MIDLIQYCSILWGFHWIVFQLQLSRAFASRGSDCYNTIAVLKSVGNKVSLQGAALAVLWLSCQALPLCTF